MSFLRRFQRITSSDRYLPEVDGLRFVAIFSVVVIMHIPNYINEKFLAYAWIRKGYQADFHLNGGWGVALFFIISGFILSLPFARWRLLGEQPVALSAYYLRRLTRLEPPYLIALIVFFVLHVWVLHKYSFSFLLPRLLSSATYTHLLVYEEFSPVLPVAWSLEIEVQFYVLAPFFFLLFLLKQRYLRWAIYCAIIVCSAVYWYNVWTIGTVVRSLHYFFAGILLADLYCSKVVLLHKKAVRHVAGALCLLVFFFLPAFISVWASLAKLLSMMLLLHLALTDEGWRKAFAQPLLRTIGGMCYSIYLLHFGIISALGYALLGMGFRVQGAWDILLLFVLFLLAVLVVSALYFLGVEKPFMKNWLRKKP